MDCAKTPLDKAFDNLKKFEVYCASDLIVSQYKGRGLKNQFKGQRKKLRADVMKELHLDPKISEKEGVEKVFEKLAKAEIALDDYTGHLKMPVGRQLVQEVATLRDELPKTANMVGERAPKRARTAYASGPEAPAAAGGSGDFVDLTQEDD
jgi:hypothetical protein